MVGSSLHSILRYSAECPIGSISRGQPPDALEILLQVGALDVETGADGLAAILPDTVTQDTVVRIWAL